MYGLTGFSTAVLVAAGVQPALAAVVESIAQAPSSWSATAAPDQSEMMTLQVALAYQNLDQMTDKLYKVSDPSSGCYGTWMEKSDVDAMVAPSQAAQDAVMSWLKSAGVTHTAVDGAIVNFATTVGNANKMLNTTFANYQKNGVTKLRTTQYSVPDDIAQHIDLISPTVFFGNPVAAGKQLIKAEPATATKKEVSKRQIDASCQTSITPNCIRELYQVTGYKADPNSGSKINFGSFLDQAASYADLEDYEQHFGLPSRNFSVTLINGGVNNQSPSNPNITEADLDVQNIVGTTSGLLPVGEYITGGVAPFIPNLDEPTPASDSNEAYLPYYQYLLSQENSALPQVITNSYGDDEDTVPIHYAKRVCNMIGMLGLRGISVLESAGDTGVGGPCLSNDGKKTVQFTPQFPGTCPFITAVGGTQAVTPEVAWVDGSGGFSNYFPRAPYQQQAVQTYLDRYISPAVKAYYQPYTNFNGRGFPDVSAHSLTPDYQVVYDGQLSPSGGTSAASPVFASVIALLNDARLRAGLPVLGFLNPWIYSSGYKALHDITMGGSVGCNGVNGQTGMVYNGSGIIPYATWNATVGWDPVTGYGTPDFVELKDQVLKMGCGKKCW